MNLFDEKRAENTAASSASLLLHMLPNLMMLPAPQAYDRIREHLQTCIYAYIEQTPTPSFPPQPSAN
ncbi:hypothetical protein [Fimbriiglobus ruber]|uniref:Uncharacterized protein n=1 Tax=Fimbriiglobus ruber TaxID=1908690 RepID=A0A225DDB3_9BACT|nr:hypothetical protein [Fimbriiglobus ruber]OWK39462.1 hypothetical protein FRUB_06025 [Fimbriiglobus ruber]